MVHSVFSAFSVWSPRPRPPPRGLPYPSSCDLARLPGASLSPKAQGACQPGRTSQNSVLVAQLLPGFLAGKTGCAQIATPGWAAGISLL